MMGYILVIVFLLSFPSCSDSEKEETESIDEIKNKPSDELFDPNEIIDIKIKMDSEDWNFIRNQKTEVSFNEDCLDQPFEKPYEYRPATIVINGYKIKNAGVRKKGFLSSLDNERPSLKIKLDKYVEEQEIFSLERLTLNNNKSADIFLSQCLSYNIFKKAGVVSPRCNFANVTVNGKNLGLYTHLDSIKKRFIRLYFKNDEGRLFEGTWSDFKDGWGKTFEIKTNEENNDTSAISKLTETLLLPDDELEEKLLKIVDMEEFYKFWAIENLIDHVDGYTNAANNFYIYVDPDSGLMHFIPWGTDMTFGNTENTIFARAALSRRLMLNDKTREKFIKVMNDILENVWKEDELIEYVELINSVCEVDYAYSKPNSEKVIEFIKRRKLEMKALLDDPLSNIGEELESPCDIY